MNAMHKTQIAKGVGIGMAVGGAVGLAGSALKKPGYQHAAKKTVNRAFKTFSNVLDAIQ
ncbi:MAG: hypothetical protein LBS96_02695 [Oscillospiraceae bacterium]|jgi:hypothetical protein|nr:hypothetical protein [Oscillospiraceae bacterium]